MHGIFVVLLVHNFLGTDTDNFKENLGKAVIHVCIIGLMVFFTDALPIQHSLDDSFVSLFTKDIEAEESKSSFPEPAGSENKNEAAPLNIEETKTTTEIVEKRKRFSLKEYTEKNLSLNDMIAKIKDKIVKPEDIKLNEIISSQPNSLGKIYKAQAKLNNTEQTVAVRLIEFPKLPSYLLEGVYLEMAYYKENQCDCLVPLLGFSCNSPKLFFIMPQYEYTLNQLIYHVKLSPQEKLKAIR